MSKTDGEIEELTTAILTDIVPQIEPQIEGLSKDDQVRVLQRLENAMKNMKFLASLTPEEHQRLREFWRQRREALANASTSGLR
jgi:hypothetical protein